MVSYGLCDGSGGSAGQLVPKILIARKTAS
jgi:hypothetical protein